MFWEMKENVEEDWFLHNLSKIKRKKKRCEDFTELLLTIFYSLEYCVLLTISIEWCFFIYI
jgi:hypothetical protein